MITAKICLLQKANSSCNSKQTSETLVKQDEAAFAALSCLAAQHGRSKARGGEAKGGGEDGGE